MTPKRFSDRREAGRLLAAKLAAYANRPDVVVLALPRGGVPVAFEVAQALNAPLDVFVVRKLGVPGYEELAMGAVATGGLRVLNEQIVQDLRIPGLRNRPSRCRGRRGVDAARACLPRRSSASRCAWSYCDPGR